MVIKRDTLATNAGLTNFVDYAFKSKLRFDYTPEHCFDFHAACEKEVMPFCAALDEKRTRELGIETLMPWDIGVDPKNRPPLRPFDDGADLVAKTQRVFERLDPELGRMFASLGDGRNTQGIATGELLDLEDQHLLLLH